MRPSAFGTLTALVILTVGIGFASAQAPYYPSQAGYGSDAAATGPGQQSWFQYQPAGYPTYAGNPMPNGQPQMAAYGGPAAPQNPEGMAYPPTGATEAAPTENAPAEAAPAQYLPRWTGTVDAMWMTRFGGRRETLVSDASTGATLFTSSDMNFNLAGGPRVDVIRHADCGWDVEFAYFSIDGWNASDSATAPSGVQFNNAGIQVTTKNDTTGMDFMYLSKLYSGELNVRHAVDEQLTILAGFRTLQLEDRLRGVVTANGVASPTSFIDVATENYLYGFQIGGDATLWTSENGRFRIDSLLKAGVFGNYARQNTGSLLTGENASAAGNHAAFFGEVSFTAVWQFSKHIAARGGYQAMWIQSAALAPNQLSYTNLPTQTATLDQQGAVFYHGAFAGLEVDY
jgi:hypothetical protein